MLSDICKKVNLLYWRREIYKVQYIKIKYKAVLLEEHNHFKTRFQRETLIF